METTLFIMTLIVGWFLGIFTMAGVFVYILYRDDKKRTNIVGRARVPEVKTVHRRSYAQEALEE